MSYDYSALHRPMTKKDTDSYRARFVKKSTKQMKITVGIIALLIILAFSPVLINAARNGELTIAVIIFGVIVSLIVVFVIIATIKRRRFLTRLLAFATANNIVLVTDRVNPSYPGVIFSLGHSRRLSEALVLPNGHEIGNYTYSTGSGRSRRTYYWHYMRVKLVRRLPHMLLDARKNNVLRGKYSNLPTSFKKDQIMTLEGNFNDFFTLYAPKGYERDAMYVFTPDVMAALIDFGADHDIEVVDDNLIFYKKGTKNLTKEKVLTEALSVINRVSSEIIDQGDYYADDRVGDRAANSIANQGRRLKSRWSVATILIILFFITAVAGLLYLSSQ